MTAFPSKHSKVGVTLPKFVDQFCGHKVDCITPKCKMQPSSEVDSKADIAYADETHCEKFRHEDGGLPGADILEIGTWK